MKDTQDTVSSDFEQVAIAYQEFCRAIDRAALNTSIRLRNRPELPGFEKQIRAIVPQTLPVFLNTFPRLSEPSPAPLATNNQQISHLTK